MAENDAEPKAGSGLVKKLLIFGGGGVLLIAIGLGAGFLIFGSAQPDPSEEIEEIIERKMLQVGVGVSTQYDDTVMMNVESHQLALRSVILGVISDFSEDDVKGATGREKLAVALRDAINGKLEALEDFGGVEEVHFTSFVLQ